MASEIDTKALRNAFGSFATGVTIVSYTNSKQEHFGMTVNSFSSVSLAPPLLLWNLQKNSDCFDDIMQAKHYAVNVLSSAQGELSTCLARKGMHSLAALEGQNLWKLGEHCPVICDTLACFECAVHNHYEGGDHMICVGEVLRYTHSGGDPLVFFSGGYAALRHDAP